jgi:hypothetical protein
MRMDTGMTYRLLVHFLPFVPRIRKNKITQADTAFIIIF